MANEDWKLQWSIKTPTGDLINVRANTAEELSVLLEGIAEVSGQAASTSKVVHGAYTVAPLSTAGSGADTPPWESSATSQPQAASGMGLSSPTCVHGSRKFLSGISKKNGKPYSMWVCPQPQGADQCSPVNG
jgi:hypothetical protein